MEKKEGQESDKSGWLHRTFTSIPYLSITLTDFLFAILFVKNLGIDLFIKFGKCSNEIFRGFRCLSKRFDGFGVLVLRFVCFPRLFPSVCSHFPFCHLPSFLKVPYALLTSQTVNTFLPSDSQELLPSIGSLLTPPLLPP